MNTKNMHNNQTIQQLEYLTIKQLKLDINFTNLKCIIQSITVTISFITIINHMLQQRSDVVWQYWDII